MCTHTHYVIVVSVGLLCLLGGCGGGILNCPPDAADPFQDRWEERSSISCEDGSESDGVIAEIIFCQDQFTVTWTPFESYIDYWGDYSLDPETNELTMTVTGGNFIPDDTDLAGTVEFQDDGSIVLRDIYFGTRNGESPLTAACGHVLEPL